MTEEIGAEDMMAMMCQRMRSMCGGEPEKMKEMMSKMMPEMMKGCMEGMEAEDMIKTMHEMMPQMMENCLSSMSDEERKEMFTFCHDMLREMEEKFMKKE